MDPGAERTFISRTERFGSMDQEFETEATQFLEGLGFSRESIERMLADYRVRCDVEVMLEVSKKKAKE